MEGGDNQKDDATSESLKQQKEIQDIQLSGDQSSSEQANEEGTETDQMIPDIKENNAASSTSTGEEKLAADNSSHCDAEDNTDEVIDKRQGSDDEGSKDVDEDEDMEGEDEGTKHLGREGEFTSEIFKIMLRNLPTRFGFQQLRKMLAGLQLKPKKLKALRNKDYAFVTFSCEEDRQKAMEVLNKHVWKGRRLSAKFAKPNEDPMVALKRKQENQGGGGGKKTKGDQNADEHLPIEDRLNNAVTPLWKQDYQDQLKEKRQIKEDLLRRLAITFFNDIPAMRNHISEQREKYDGLCCQLEDIKPSPIVTGYRNKCEFSIGKNPDGEEKTVGFRLGLYKGGQISVVNPSACPNVPGNSKAVVQSFQTYIRQSSLPAYDPMTHRGHWKMLTVRTTQGSGVMAMVTFHRQSLSEDDVEKEKQKLAEYFGEGEGKSCGITSLFVHVQWQGDKNAIKFDHIHGDRYITEDLLQLKFRISPEAFFQVNTPAAELLYTTIGDWAQVTKITTLLDICCGTGTIGISLAKRVDKVIGVEMNGQAVENAKENAAINGVDNVTFYCGKAEDLLPGITNRLHNSLDVIGIVDPPRAGLHQRVVQAIRRCPKLNRLIYVSCDAKQASNNFLNLCRSMSKKQKGVPFTLVKAIPVDLFPHTSHCELVLLFERNLSKKTESNSNSSSS
ncbi:tRNA (uracil-5-)-methyltransferase homolog A-like [Lytechinus variegatus]|uniref:tRNA (uracil-5-)-methyltransferase homolog A-like n=1 Tax=Lytechinus variegatus TaxID=7654 RepID=UPI001BB2444C|nr:tRNA (uracil-5-)-methyltransferase homolog A-like [Lytechinus variegatus]